MANVTKYQVLCYGSDDGYLGCRAQVMLSDDTRTLGYLRFHDPGMPFPADSDTGISIIMHMPTAMLASVVDMLRNEAPIHFYFNTGHAFLGTSAPEAVGEAEIAAE